MSQEKSFYRQIWVSETTGWAGVKTPRCEMKSFGHANNLPSAGHEKQHGSTKTKCLSSSHCSPFNCCLSIILSLDKRDYTETLHAEFCPNKQSSFEPFMCLDPLLTKLLSADALSTQDKALAVEIMSTTKCSALMTNS